MGAHHAIVNHTGKYQGWSGKQRLQGKNIGKVRDFCVISPGRNRHGRISRFRIDWSE